jgi:hypothetical protein
MDSNEQPLEGVSVSLNRNGGMARTSARGTAFVPNLPVYQPIDVGIVGSTIEDPLWIPAREGASVVLRPGKVLAIDFPVVASGEVTGTVFQSKGGATREAAGIELELVDGQGSLVKQVRTAYDGFYDVTAIPPGRYLLRVKAEQAAQRELAAPPPRVIEVGPSGTVLDGVDLVVSSLRPSATATAVPVAPSVAAPPAVASPPETVVPRAAPPLVAPSSQTRQVYAVQVGSFRERSGAEAQSAQIATELGSKGRVVTVDLGDRGRWYRVLIGEFSSEASALEFRGTLAARMAVGPVFRIERQP